MFKATKPFNDRLSAYPREPSLRIGNTVPDNAVNLAYYYNPTATDVEKILTAESPRNTIDHRVEEAYRYLFDQASDDDDLFPGFVSYEDEEGYKGKLGRMYVQWYPETHIETKNIQDTKQIVTTTKSELPKMFEYSDDDGYTGNLYLDTQTFTVTKEKDITTTEIIDREVFNHEISFHEIFGRYIQPNQLDLWMKEPGSAYTSQFPYQININGTKATGIGNGNSTVLSYIKNTPVTQYDYANGDIEFDHMEYQQVGGSTNSTSGASTVIQDNGLLFYSDEYHYEDALAPPSTSTPGTSQVDELKVNEFVTQCTQKAQNLFRSKYQSTYNAITDTYSYDEIKNFISTFKNSTRCSDPNHSLFTSIQNAMNENKDIVIVKDRVDMEVGDLANLNSKFWFVAKYKVFISGRGQEGTYEYNVIAVYKGMLKKQVTTVKKVAAEYLATATYTGLARKVWYDYDGMAYYRGAVTKGNGIGNVNPSDDNEILMYSDDKGYLRRPVYVTNEYGVRELKNFYRVESDYVYLTDVFKDGIACFYRHRLKRPIYDYRGPDDRGFYEGDAVKIFTSNMKEIPSDYKYNMKLYTAETETIQKVTNDFNLVSEKVPMRYYADLYMSFISNATDTFKVTYNAFDDNDKNNIALDNGVTEDVYGYPFMIQGIDFTLEPIDERTRVNKIHLLEPARIQDTRRYISFTYTITAENKQTGKKFTTSPRTVSILNKDYVVPAEYSKFDGRAMIISPEADDILQSPMDMVLYDQAASKTETVITAKDTDFIFYATITEIENQNRGGVNIRCNPDGSGYITAETTIETGFYDEDLGTYTKKLCLDSPYFIEGGYIYPGFKVKCMDARRIKILNPRDDALLASWYPRIQFGHYSQILDQYGAHVKVSYTMPEYDTQYFSTKYGKPYVDVKAEKVTILNSHTIKTHCYPIHLRSVYNDTNTYYFKNKAYKVYQKVTTWKEAQEFCLSLNGNLAMPKTESENNFITNIVLQYDCTGVWLGATDESSEGKWMWVDGTPVIYTNWVVGEPNNLSNTEHYLELYAASTDSNNNTGKWNDLSNDNTSTISGFVCEFKGNPLVKAYKKVDDELFELEVENVSFSDGVIYLKDTISENDNIICDYTYVEESYVYRGFWRNVQDFARIDLNPNIYHTYSDLNYTPSEDKPSKNLFNKVIYFFMKPRVVYELQSEKNDSLIFDLEDDSQIGEIIADNKECLYHKIDDDQPDSDLDIYIGSVYIRQNTSLHSTVIVDSRTRGGGVLSSMKDSLRKTLEPESDYYLDIGYYDGEPYQENGVVIIRLDNSLLKEFGGRFTHGDIESKVKRWLGFGVYPIIEYVDAYSKREMPQYNLDVTDSYSNITSETPELLVECITK